MPTIIQEGMDENLAEDETPRTGSGRKWPGVMNARYGLEATTTAS